jgi:hypothetical protein
MKRISALLLVSLCLLTSLATTSASAETLTSRDWRNMQNMLNAYMQASHDHDVYTLADLSEPQVLHKLALMAGYTLGRIDYTLLPESQKIMQSDPNYFFTKAAPMSFHRTSAGRIYGIMPVDSSYVQNILNIDRPVSLLIYREAGRWYMWEVLNEPEYVALAATHSDFTNAPIFITRK